MKLLCTNCGFDIDSKTANVHTNLVKCPNCHTIHKIDLLLEKQEKTNDLRTKDFIKERPRNAIFDNQKYELLTFEPVPKDSKIEIFDTSTSLEINIPTHGFEGKDIFMIFFNTFWLGFVAIWTLFASSASIFFAMFSIPFWLVGIGMASGLISKFTERQFIELDKYTLRVTKTRIFSQRIYEFDIEDIDKINEEKPTFKSFFGSTKWNTTSSIGNDLMPVIKARNMNLAIFEFVSKSEQDWGIKVLKQGIAKFSERKV